jgi:hypothetical protein
MVWPIVLVDEMRKKNSKSGIILPTTRADKGKPIFRKGMTTAG